MEKFNNKGGLISVILLITSYLLTVFIRLNLSYLLRINVKELSDYNLTAFKLGSFFIGIIIILSYSYLALDIFKIFLKDNKKLVLNDL